MKQTATVVDDPCITARQALTHAAQQVQHAAERVAQHQDAALPLALRHRDLQDAVRMSILAEDDARVREAQTAYHAARQALERARADHHRAEQAHERTAEALARQEALADRQRRRVWAEEQHPDIAIKLLQAQQEEARLRANEYARDSGQGQADLRAIRYRIRRFESALERAAAQAPAG